MTSKQDRFAVAFQMPPAMRPYIDLVVSEHELDLVLGLSEQPMTLDQVAEMLDLARDEAQELVAGAFQRDVIDRETVDGAVVYTPGRFYANMDYWTAYDNPSWRTLPAWTRHAVSEWQIQEFIKLWTPAFEVFARDIDAWVRIKNRDVLLLHEALELVDAAEHVCLLPCACRTTLMPGSALIEGSMRLGERARQTLERGQGRSMTREEAKAHLVALDRAGFVHTGPRAWRQHDPKLEWISHGNCSPVYSFPFIAGMRLGLHKEYPRAHYEAVVDWERCTHCGVCIGRCLFDAFVHTGATLLERGETKKQVEYDPARCWGCGLCVNTCPEEAIAMRPL